MPESAAPASRPSDAATIASVTTVAPDRPSSQAADRRAVQGPVPAADAIETVIHIAHLSDPHLTRLDDVRWQTLRGKRLLGYLSWRHNRRQMHQRAVLDAVTADAIDGHPGHFAITGDLTHIGLAAEHEAARAWLNQLQGSAPVSLAPGNHDLYAADSAASMYAEWATYLPLAEAWPRVQVSGDVHFISLCSGAPSEPLFATGQLGDDQLAGVREALRAGAGGVRVLLIHHSPHPASHAPRKQLRDRGALIQVLAESGAELILHGHSHRAVLLPLTAGRYRIPVLGAPSASVASGVLDRAGGYHRIVIERGADGLHARLTTRRWTDQGMVTSQSLTLRLGGVR